MPRLKPLTPDRMNEEQLDAYRLMMGGSIPEKLEGLPPLGGPYNLWIRSPDFYKVMAPFSRFVREEGCLEQRLVELAIIVVGRVWSAEFEFAAHAPIAVQAGISQDIVDAIRNEQQPEFDKADEAAVFKFSKELTFGHKVSPETYQGAIDQLGEKGLVELIGLLGFYVLVCMALNAFEVPLMDGMEKPFPDLP